MNIKIFCRCSLFPFWSAKDLSAPLYMYIYIYIRIYIYTYIYRSADKSLAPPPSRCILFDGENISFDASLVIYINSTNIPPIMNINRIYEHKNLLSLQLVSFLVGLRIYQHLCVYIYIHIRIYSGVLISPQPDLLPDVFCLMVRIFHLMLVLLYI